MVEVVLSKTQGIVLKEVIIDHIYNLNQDNRSTEKYKELSDQIDEGSRQTIDLSEEIIEDLVQALIEKQETLDAHTGASFMDSDKRRAKISTIESILTKPEFKNART